MGPIVFEPILKRIRWGGRRLGTTLGKPIGNASDYAESWEVADHGVDQSVVAEGECGGLPLRKLVESRAYELFGRERVCSQFPLLIKYLDAHDRLSLQVHPDDDLAKQYDANENGKTEAWVIIDAQPGSRLFAGLKSGVDRSTLEAALRAGTAEEVVHSFSVSPGDCVFIPAGTVHAIGEGILLAEIQQMSDITFRLFDWGWLDADGNPRTLHIEEGLAATDFARGPVSPVVPSMLEQSRGRTLEELVSGEYFVIHRHTLDDGGLTRVSPGDRFHVLMVVEGRVDLRHAGAVMALGRGRTALLPADCAADVDIVAHGATVVVDSFTP